MTQIIETPTYTLHQGDAPILISIPHLGTQLPNELIGDFNDEAFQLADTDWHLDRLYAVVKSLGASLLCAKVSRYAIDLNRPSTGESLYPGQTTTGLCPTTTFKGAPLYKEGREPTAAEIQRRVDAYWRPYHDTLKAELSRLRAAHTKVLLWEAHSIASVLPRLFEGKLPDLNFGTNDGAACDPALLAAVVAPLAQQNAVDHVVNGRFKGGFITRHFGQPAQGIQAIQLEMCQSLYMNESYPFSYREDLATGVQPLLHDMLSAGLKHLRGAVTA